jgi:hypothetical protein
MPRKADPATTEELLKRIESNIAGIREMRVQGSLGSLAMAKTIANTTKNDLSKVVSKLEKELNLKIMEVENERVENHGSNGRKTIKIRLPKQD